MRGNLGNLGNLTPNPQQNRLFPKRFQDCSLGDLGNLARRGSDSGARHASRGIGLQQEKECARRNNRRADVPAEGLGGQDGSPPTPGWWRTVLTPLAGNLV